jgi:hypothetical protein
MFNIHICSLFRDDGISFLTKSSFENSNQFALCSLGQTRHTNILFSFIHVYDRWSINFI